MPLNFKNTNDRSHTSFWTVLFLVLSIACLLVYSTEGTNGPLHAVQSGASVVASPFASAGSAVGAGISATSTAVSDASADADTLSALKEQNETLRQQVAELEEYRQEAERLESLLMVKSTLNVDGISASVVGRSGEAYSQTITINAGSEDGVDVGQTVMGSTGVVGQVISVTEKLSTVRLLTDPQSGAAAIVQSSRAEGIVRGSLDGLLYLEDLDTDAQVVVGDVVVTSGQGGSYVSGLIIGTVVRVDDSTGTGSQKIVVSPNDTVDTLQDVIVVCDSSGSTDATDATDATTNANSSEGGN